MRTIFLLLFIGVLLLSWLGQSDASGQTVVELARGDLASRLHVPVDQVELVSLTPINWPDACLGVRSPGFVCAQVVTPGFVLSFRVNGKTYIYNTSQVEAIFIG